MPNYEFTVGPFVTTDGVKILVLDPQRKAQSRNEKFDLAQGESITIKTTRGCVIQELRIYEDDHENKTKGALIREFGQGANGNIMNNNAWVEVHRDRARLEHKGREMDSYRFEIDFGPGTSGEGYFTWDPDVHETKPGNR